MPVRVGSSPDNAGTCQDYRMVRVRQASGEGVREEPAFVKPLKMIRQLKSGGYGLDGGAHPLFMTGGELLGWIDVAGREVTVKVCGVAVTMPQGHSWAPNSTIGLW
jgi:hypothetical protein